ncbi:hypothetical protein CL617_04940 [archaeon]|nr:hypothetical protein [archaeon]|tara:strand:- start:365 stop:571 length:207 start_codon:yes stop_codon:yes gene_type:complete
MVKKKYNMDKLINSNAEVNRMYKFLIKIKFATKNELYRRDVYNDGDSVAELFRHAIKKGFIPRKRFLK